VDWQPLAVGAPPPDPEPEPDPELAGDDWLAAGEEVCAACFLRRCFLGFGVGLGVGDGVEDADAFAACDAASVGAALGAAVPQAARASTGTATATAARSANGSLVRPRNPRPLVLGDMPTSAPLI
jgi:hypothetical protein